MMNEFDDFPTQIRDGRYSEQPLTLNAYTEQKIANNLVDVAEILEAFTPPTSRQRIVENVQLKPDESVTQMPSRYNLLQYHSAEFASNKYKIKLTLPGQTLVLEGTRPDQQSAWQVYKGTELTKVLEHVDVAAYIGAMLPMSTYLKGLLDTPLVNDKAMNEALWQDLHTTTSDWKDVSYYNASEDTYIKPPEIIGDQHLAPTDGEIDAACYISSIASVIAIHTKRSGKTYTLRVGTEAPIIVDGFSSEQSADELTEIYHEPLFRHENAGKTKTIELNKEFRLSVEALKDPEDRYRALAVLAIESSDLTSKGLELLALSTALDLQGKLEPTYRHAIDLVNRKHLDVTELNPLD